MSKRNSSEWPIKQRPNPASRIPYGYKANPEDRMELVPIWDLVGLLEQTLDSLDNGASFRQSAEWLTVHSGHSVSHSGLKNIWLQRRGTPDNERFKKLEEQRKKNKPKTKEGRVKRKLNHKLAGKQASLNSTKRKLQALKDTEREEVVAAGGTAEPDEIVPRQETVVFVPNEGPQTNFLAAPEREVLYGGAAGGGKSYGLIADPMRYFHHPQFAGIILRRTNDELRELIWKTQELYPKAFKGAKWKSQKSEWEFPNGGRLWMSYLERDEDVLRYQGQAFCYIGIDELTQYATPFAWNYMRSRLRTTAPDLPIFMRATTNPGGPGHGWVKRMFIDPAPANKAYWATDIETGEVLARPATYPQGHPKAGKPSDKAGQPLFKRKFIPASLYDNKYLAEDGAYEANLLSMPEGQRRQLLEGDWSIAEGAAFNEYRAHLHTVEPFEIPPEWRRFRSCDYGYSTYSAVHWFAIDPVYETLYVYRELYLSKHTGEALADAILEAEGSENLSYGVLDSSCWHQRGQRGPSIAEVMIQRRCRWRPSDRTKGSRVAGKNRLHELLKVNEETELPGIVFFNTCRQIIADLPVIPSCPKGSDDIDVRYSSDHAYDSVRYGIMTRPKSFSMLEDWGKSSNSTYRPASRTFGY